jgi:transcriptional regulator with PAS, ATPase and Fis domain
MHHPIISEFINTGGILLEIVEKHYDNGQFLECVFFRLTRSFITYKEEGKLYIDLDQAVINGHQDSELYFLFIAYSIGFSVGGHQIEKANTLAAIGNSLLSEKIHITLKAYFASSVAGLKFAENKFEECDKFAKEALAQIDKKNPRFISIFGIIATTLAYRGQLKDFDLVDLEIFESQKNEYRIFGVIQTKLNNCIIIGDLKEGIGLFELAKQKIKELNLGINSEVIQNMGDLLKILSRNYDENQYENVAFKRLVNVCKAIASGNLIEANKKYLSLASEFGDYMQKMPFYRYIKLHMELSLKNKGKAHLLLLEIQEKFGCGYMDDLFLARIQLLEMKKNSAYETFSRLLKNVERYGAMNRLLFELQFAKDLSLEDILFLSRGIRDVENLNLTNTKKQENLFSNQPKKGVKLLIGESQSMVQMKKLIKKFANLKEPVLITGETGTGKELVSRAIHEEGPNAKEPFFAINCGALTESLLESELFGYEAGSFTGALKERQGIFESAGKGTVFLDEFGDITPKMQVSLLRVLESNEIRLIGGTKTRQVNCKIVIATNIELQKAVEEKKFREDLYFRLNRFDIKLAPLRERVEDIPKLIDYFLNVEKETSAKPKIVSKSLLKELMAYQWPGNIRELKNEMDRLKILHSDKEVFELEDFDFAHLQGMPTQIPPKEETSKPQKSPQLPKNEEVSNDRITGILNSISKTEQRHEFLKKLFQKHKTLTRLQVMKITEVSQSTASNDLAFLCKSGVIEKHTPTKSSKSRYFSYVE